MHYTSQYPSPLGELLLAADDDGLTGVWFVGQKYFARSLARRCFLVKCLRTKKKQIRSHRAARPQVMG